MSKNIPNVGSVPAMKKPVVNDNKSGQVKCTFSFSFKFFKQVEYFGLGDVAPKWFVSLLERLKELSKEDTSSFFKNHEVKGANRYHKINWDSKNVPIKREDIDWIGKDIIENEEDYPFFQFQVSSGLGRVIGYWETGYQFFNIVLLDPKHNMQPSKEYNYKVDNTSIEHCEFSSLLMDIDRIKGAKCLIDGCQCKEELSKLPTKLHRGRFVYFQVDEEYYEEFLSKTKTKSIKDIIELGLLSD